MLAKVNILFLAFGICFLIFHVCIYIQYFCRNIDLSFSHHHKTKKIDVQPHYSNIFSNVRSPIKLSIFSLHYKLCFLGVNDGCFIFLCVYQHLHCNIELSVLMHWKITSRLGFSFVTFFDFSGCSAKSNMFYVSLPSTCRCHIDLNVSSLLYRVCGLFFLVEFNSFHVCVTVSHQSSWTLIKRNFFLHRSHKSNLLVR